MPIFFFTAFAGGLSAVDSAPGFDYPAGYTAFEYGFVLLQASAFSGCSPASRSHPTSSSGSDGACSSPPRTAAR